MRVAHQLVQSADIHRHLVLVHHCTRVEYSRNVRVDTALFSEQGQPVDRTPRSSH